MASGLQIWLAFTILLLMFCSLAEGEPQVPCYFIFGDSLVDNGNNNNLTTQAKANYPPYGIDFPDGPTGRFTNGRNIADFLAEILGFTNSRPPFMAAATSEEEIMKGVNYASGAGGILEQTGRYLGDRFSLERQVMYHNETVSRIGQHMKNLSLARTHLRNCLYSVGFGSNDYLHTLLRSQNSSASHRPYTPQRFAHVLIKQYTTQLRNLYALGARKVAVFGIGKLGCIPRLKEYAKNNASLPPSSCAEPVNAAVEMFDDKLRHLILRLNRNLSGAKFIFLNMTSISQQDLPALGITNVNDPCCKVSSTILKGQCEPNQKPCSNREAYMFWDSYHPSQTSSLAIAKRSYTSSLVTDAYPMDIRSLVQLALVQKM